MKENFGEMTFGNPEAEKKTAEKKGIFDKMRGGASRMVGGALLMGAIATGVKAESDLAMNTAAEMEKDGQKTEHVIKPMVNRDADGRIIMDATIGFASNMDTEIGDEPAEVGDASTDKYELSRKTRAIVPEGGVGGYVELDDDPEKNVSYQVTAKVGEIDSEFEKLQEKNKRAKEVVYR